MNLSVPAVGEDRAKTMPTTAEPGPGLTHPL